MNQEENMNQVDQLIVDQLIEDQLKVDQLRQSLSKTNR